VVRAVERVAALIPAHLEGGCLLPQLHLLPERIVNDAQVRDLGRHAGPCRARGALAGPDRFFCRMTLLIVDEIGDLPVVSGGRNLFFQLVNARFEHGAMI
jgi:hypothetical protein